MGFPYVASSCCVAGTAEDNRRHRRMHKLRSTWLRLCLVHSNTIQSVSTLKINQTVLGADGSERAAVGTFSSFALCMELLITEGPDPCRHRAQPSAAPHTCPYFVTDAEPLEHELIKIPPSDPALWRQRPATGSHEPHRKSDYFVRVRLEPVIGISVSSCAYPPQNPPVSRTHDFGHSILRR